MHKLAYSKVYQNLHLFHCQYSIFPPKVAVLQLGLQQKINVKVMIKIKSDTIFASLMTTQFSHRRSQCRALLRIKGIGEGD